MRNKSFWRFNKKPQKNNFPRNSIMGKLQEKQLAHELGEIIAQAYISEEAAWAAMLPSPF